VTNKKNLHKQKSKTCTNI